MPHRYHVLDVFTETPLAGNPLAVVHDAADLDDAAMQKIAAEFNLSETVFLLEPEKPVHAAKVRIFTPERELPFAGHPTVGTAVLLALDRWSETRNAEGIIVLEAGIGDIRVGVSLNSHRSFAEFDIPKLPEKTGEAPDKELAAAALGLMPSEIGFENHRPSRWSVGMDFPFLPVRNLDILRRCRVEPKAFAKAFGSSVYVYCRDTFGRDNDFHARMFAPGMGIAEDPATGSAAAAFAGVIMEFDRPTGGMHRYRIEQGHLMERPSFIELELGVQGKLDLVRIGGAAVLVAEGQLKV